MSHPRGSIGRRTTRFGRALSLVLVNVVTCSVLGGQTPSAYWQYRGDSGDDVVSLAFSADGAFLLFGDEGGHVGCLDIQRKALISLSEFECPLIFLSFLSDNRSFVGVGENGKVFLTSLAGKGPEVLNRTNGKPSRAAMDQSRRFLAIATDREKIEMLDLQEKLPFGVIDGRDRLDELLFLGFDRLGEQIAGVNTSGKVISWNPTTQRILRELSLNANELYGGRSRLASVSSRRSSNVLLGAIEETTLPKGGIKSGKDLERNYSLIAYDWGTGIEIKRVKTGSAFSCLAYGPGVDRATGYDDESRDIKVIDLRKGELAATISVESEPGAISIADNDQWLAAGFGHAQVSLWRFQVADVQGIDGPSSLPSLTGRIRPLTDSTPIIQRGRKTKLAILSFEADGIQESVGNTCLNVMSTILSNVKDITLLERNKIDKILQQQKLRLSSLTEEDGAQIGKLLNADLVLLCSVGRLGSSYNFTARAISVETGVVLPSRGVTCEECGENDIRDSLLMLTSLIAYK